MKRKSLVLALVLVAMNFSLAPLVSQTQPALAKTNVASDSDTVSFNTQSKKYHTLGCEALSKCKHCVKMTRGEVKAKGGVPCKICGAGEK